jgi:copper oxidase (laccase) domain-containing protein
VSTGVADPPREIPGRAHGIDAILLEGFGSGPGGRPLLAGVTTAGRSFRWRDRLADPGTAAAYGELEDLAGSFGGWARVEQVHGAELVEIGSGAVRAHDPAGSSPGSDRAAGPGLDPTLGRADGLLRRAGSRGPRLLTVTVADCVPVYLAWPGGYALLHAGWRGIAAGILEAAFERIGAPPGAVRLHAGPAIGGCCYEVGPEVEAALFGDVEGRESARTAGALVERAGPRRGVDLRRALRLRAEALGAAPDAVTTSTLCTACDPRLHSFRRAGGAEARRLMLAFLGEPLAD